MSIISDKYREARAAFQADPIVQDMAGGLRGTPMNEITHEDGTPRSALMMAANREYKSRGGLVQSHGLGDLAHAILDILNS